jgi:hypothetical protein
MHINAIRYPVFLECCRITIDVDVVTRCLNFARGVPPTGYAMSGNSIWIRSGDAPAYVYAGASPERIIDFVRSTIRTLRPPAPWPSNATSNAALARDIRLDLFVAAMCRDKQIEANAMGSIRSRLVSAIIGKRLSPHDVSYDSNGLIAAIDDVFVQREPPLSGGGSRLVASENPTKRKVSGSTAWTRYMTRVTN